MEALAADRYSQWSRELACAMLGYDAAGRVSAEQVRFQNQPELALKLLERIQPLLVPTTGNVTQNIQINAQQAVVKLRALRTE